jgi:hypothetical protein
MAEIIRTEALQFGPMATPAEKPDSIRRHASRRSREPRAGNAGKERAMAKNTRRGIRPAGDSGSGARGSDDERSAPLLRPSVTVPAGGEDPAEFGEAGIRGVVMNPIYTGIGE